MVNTEWDKSDIIHGRIQGMIQSGIFRRDTFNWKLQQQLNAYQSRNENSAEAPMRLHGNLTLSLFAIFFVCVLVTLFTFCKEMACKPFKQKNWREVRLLKLLHCCIHLQVFVIFYFHKINIRKYVVISMLAFEFQNMWKYLPISRLAKNIFMNILDFLHL